MNKLLSQVPLQILTGFLGSGKTTLLNKIINTPKMKGTVLIINEVGEIGIDDKLISSESPVVLLDSGCICCSVQDGLVNALQFLADQKQQGELSFNRVIIETTGIADPAPIITLLFDYIEIECNYRLERAYLDGRHQQVHRSGGLPRTGSSVVCAFGCCHECVQQPGGAGEVPETG